MPHSNPNVAQERTGKMINHKIIYFIVIFHVLPSGNTAFSHHFFSKLVDRTQPERNSSSEKKHKPIEGSPADLKCKYKCITANELAPTRFQARFIDLAENDTNESDEMEAPAAKFSIFNLLSDDEEEGENDEVEDLADKKDDVDTDDDIGFNFFSMDEELDSDKVEGTKESLLKQYHRNPLRMHNLLFPLLLAYKLKFFTVIPLLLGSVILLIGTTGMAGFFFALFAAAIGISVKSSEH